MSAVEQAALSYVANACWQLPRSSLCLWGIPRFSKRQGWSHVVQSLGYCGSGS